MKKYWLLLSILLVGAQSALMAKEIIIESLPSPEFMDSDGSFYSPSATSYPKITQVEQSLFKKDFTSEPIETRLKRVETELFKRSFDGYSLSQRTDTILAAASERSVDKPTLSALEKAILSKNFNDTPSKRVARMEQQVFGATQSGELNDRIETLTTAAGSYSAFTPNAITPNNTRTSRKNNAQQQQDYSQYQNYPNYGAQGGAQNYNMDPYGSPYGSAYNNTYSPQNILEAFPTKIPKQPGKIKRSLGSVASFFVGGNPTGWTPQVSPNQWGSPLVDTVPTGYGFGGQGVQPYNPNSSTFNQFRNNSYSSVPQYNPYQQYTQSPYQPQFPPLYGQGGTQQRPYQSQSQQPYGYGQSSAPQFMDLFSSGGSGSETYYDDGRYNRGFRNSGGGAAVTIIK